MNKVDIIRINDGRKWIYRWINGYMLIYPLGINGSSNR